MFVASAYFGKPTTNIGRDRISDQVTSWFCAKTGVKIAMWDEYGDQRSNGRFKRR